MFIFFGMVVGKLARRMWKNKEWITTESIQCQRAPASLHELKMDSWKKSVVLELQGPRDFATGKPSGGSIPNSAFPQRIAVDSKLKRHTA